MKHDGQIIEAGFFNRRYLRRELILIEVEFTEIKIGLSSIFIIPDKADYEMVCQQMREQGFM